MGTAVPKEAIRALVASLAGLPVSRVYWDGDPERSIGPLLSGRAAKITLNVVARATNGTEEPRRDFDDGTEEWGAHRTLTISVRADNFLASGEAFDTLEKIRGRLVWPKHRAALRDADLAFVDAPSIVSLDYSVDNRAVSAASMDVRLAHLSIDTPDAEDRATWIEFAEYTGHVES